jgi:hypothetical protein
MKKLDCYTVFEAVKSMLPQNRNDGLGSRRFLAAGKPSLLELK